MPSARCGPAGAVWELTEDDAATLINALLRETRALPQLVRRDSWGYHLHATPPEAPLAHRLAIEAAMAFADVIRTGQLDRLHRCAAVDCDNLHVVLSKNRSRRFCSTACANRTNVAAYRTRQAVRRTRFMSLSESDLRRDRAGDARGPRRPGTAGPDLRHRVRGL